MLCKYVLFPFLFLCRFSLLFFFLRLYGNLLKWRKDMGKGDDASWGSERERERKTDVGRWKRQRAVVRADRHNNRSTLFLSARPCVIRKSAAVSHCSSVDKAHKKKRGGKTVSFRDVGQVVRGDSARSLARLPQHCLSFSCRLPFMRCRKGCFRHQQQPQHAHTVMQSFDSTINFSL